MCACICIFVAKYSWRDELKRDGIICCCNTLFTILRKKNFIMPCIKYRKMLIANEGRKDHAMYILYHAQPYLRYTCGVHNQRRLSIRIVEHIFYSFFLIFYFFFYFNHSMIRSLLVVVPFVFVFICFPTSSNRYALQKDVISFVTSSYYPFCTESV